MYCPLNITQHIDIIAQITGNKIEYTKWTKLCPKCQYFVVAPLLSSTALILLAMEFTRAAQVVAGILFHSSIMTSWSCWMLDTWYFSTFRLRMPHMSVSSWWCVLGGYYVGKLPFGTVSEGRASSPASECHSTLWSSTRTQRTAQGLNFFDRPLRGLFWVKPGLKNLCMTLVTVL